MEQLELFETDFIDKCAAALAMRIRMERDRVVIADVIDAARRGDYGRRKEDRLN